MDHPGDSGRSTEEAHPASDAPDVVGVRDRVVAELVRFARAMRRAGAEVPANTPIDGARALVEVGFDDRAVVRAALRAVLLTRAADRPVFDRLFPPFWRRLRAGLDDPMGIGADDQGGSDPPDGSLTPMVDEQTGDEQVLEEAVEPGESTAPETALRGGDVGEATGDQDRFETATYSPVGRSTAVDVPETASEASGELSTAVEGLFRSLGGRRGRRWNRAEPGVVDARRTLRRSFGTGGTVLEVPERARHEDAVRTTVLVDVSRSVLDAVDRTFLVRFLRETFDRSRNPRTFFFDTEVRDVTDQFRGSTGGEVVAALERAETTWGGGTRIGEAVETVQRAHHGAVDRDTTVIVVSDGLERGDVDVLESGMAWLSGRARAVFWLNPLAAAPEYEPVCRGMAASLPYVDGLFAFTGPDDVAEMVRQLTLHWPGSDVGYEHDPRREDAVDT